MDDWFLAVESPQFDAKARGGLEQKKDAWRQLEAQLLGLRQQLRVLRQ